jgi:hypothetical protein
MTATRPSFLMSATFVLAAAFIFAIAANPILNIASQVLS